ncbi:MAG: HAD family hydrolase [Nitrososphaera sp.]|nr:HAD family hydrolase [Nitrososphaera sp.]MCI0708262.1 HAD family hydrolase [Ignavibacteriota bacterium]
MNTEVDFLTRPDDLRLFPNAAQAIREANELGVKVFVITNQSGIARGLLTEEDLDRIHRKLRADLAAEGARLDQIYYCPHHPDYGAGEYKKVCTCRKPKTGMLTQAAHEYRIQLKSSFVIGDRCVDMKAGEQAGCGTVLVLTGYGRSEKEECLESARVDYVADDLHAAWRYVKEQLRKRASAFSKD